MGNTLHPLHAAVRALDEEKIAQLLGNDNADHAIHEHAGRVSSKYTSIEYIYCDQKGDQLAKQERVLRLLVERGANVELLLTNTEVDIFASHVPISQIHLLVELGATKDAVLEGLRTLNSSIIAILGTSGIYLADGVHFDQLGPTWSESSCTPKHAAPSFAVFSTSS